MTVRRCSSYLPPTLYRVLARRRTHLAGFNQPQWANRRVIIDMIYCRFGSIDFIVTHIFPVTVEPRSPPPSCSLSFGQSFLEGVPQQQHPLTPATVCPPFPVRQCGDPDDRPRVPVQRGSERRGSESQILSSPHSYPRGECCLLAMHQL